MWSMYMYVPYHISFVQAIVTHALTHAHTHTPKRYANETLHMVGEKVYIWL